MLNLPTIADERLNIEPVRSLLEYLLSLPQDHEDRALNAEEDTRACELFYEAVWPQRACLQEWADYCTAPECKSFRTLRVWYHLARATAQYIREHELYCR